VYIQDNQFTSRTTSVPPEQPVYIQDNQCTSRISRTCLAVLYVHPRGFGPTDGSQGGKFGTGKSGLGNTGWSQVQLSLSTSPVEKMHFLQ